MKKRIISLLLAVCITAGLFPVLGITANAAYSTGHPNTHVNTGNQRADVVAIAETQLGYAESPGTKYGAWWTEVNGGSYNFVNEAWCVMFALWCTNQAGCDAAWSGMSALSSSLMSRYQSGKNGCTAYKFGSGYMPRPGDLIFVGYKGNTGYTNHVGMVVSVTDTTINTIEGNYNNKVSRSSYSLATGLRSGSSSRGIVCFGVPAYSNDTAGDTTGGPVVTPEPEVPDNYPDTGINYKTTLLSSLNVRSDASISASVLKALPAGTEVTIVDEKADSTGRMWGRLSTGGWLSLRYTTTGSSTDPIVPGEMDIEPYDAKVNCDILLIRVVPGTNADTESQLYLGNKVTIVATANLNGTEWGKLSTGGWVATKYLNKITDDTSDDNTGDTGTGDTTTEPVLFTGKVTASTLNVRDAAGNGTVVDLLRNGNEVNIYETKTLADGKLWGRCDKGWISLSYVDYTLPTTPDSGTGGTTTPVTGVDCKVTGVRVNIRAGAGTNYDIINNLPKDTAITIVETATVGTSMWGKLSTGGWISLNYTDYRTVIAQQPTNPGTGTTTPGTGTTTPGTGTTTPGTGITPPKTPTGPETAVNVIVTGNLVNVRAGAGSNHAVFSSVKQDAVISIIEVKTVSGKLWGKLSTGGWIFLTYTNYADVMAGKVAQPDAPSTPETPSGSVACKVTGNLVNVRAGAGSNHAVINSLKNGTAITIVEVSGTGSKAWGKLSTGGWISLTYTDYAAVTAVPGTPTTPGTDTTTPGTGTTTPETPSTGVACKVTGNLVNIRAGASSNHAVINALWNGTAFTIPDVTGASGKQWGKLSTGGWIYLNYTDYYAVAAGQGT
ncbi:MAG: CHAP domain-containing protein, partial [Oscillospiraceae bacterium]|nr:CHAP domain-containing protein [Oscillospiraceae bacterium]